MKVEFQINLVLSVGRSYRGSRMHLLNEISRELMLSLRDDLSFMPGLPPCLYCMMPLEQRSEVGI